MEKLFDISVVNTLKDGIKKGWWTLEDLDKPPPGWLECVNNCKGNPAFPKVIKVSNIKTLLGSKKLQPQKKK